LTSKAVLKLSEELLDRLFRDSEGAADHKIDLVYLFENVRTTLEKAEPALEYLQSRGLIHPVTGDGIYLTARGVEAMVNEQDIKELPKYQKQWSSPTPSQEPPAVVKPQGPSRPYRPILAFVDPEGQRHTFNLEWLATVGRSDDATLKLPDPRASKRHVEIKYGGDKYLLKDLGSANGTLLNGHHIDVHALQHGDVMLIGRTEVMYLCPELIPEPHGEPPPEMITAKPAPKVAAAAPDPDPTARPAKVVEPSRAPEPKAPPPKVETAKEEPPTVRAEAPPRAPSRAEPEAHPAPIRGEPIRGEPIRGEPVQPPRATNTGKVQVPPMAAAGPAKRRTAPAPAAENVMIVKGRPEAAPVVATASSDLFAAPPRERLPSDLFGEPPNASAVFGSPSEAPRAELFKEGSLPPTVRGRTASADDNSINEVTEVAGKANAGPPDLFDDQDSRTPIRGNKKPPIEAPSRAGGDDLFAPSGGVKAAPESPDLFGSGRPAPAAPDLFAPKSEQRGAPDLFAPDYGGNRTAETAAAQLPPERDELFGGGSVRGSVSPLPSDARPVPKADLLPLDEAIPFEQAEEFEPAMVIESPAEADATVAALSLLVSRRTMPLEAEAPAAPGDSTGRTSELPAWGQDKPASESLQSYAPSDAPAEAQGDGFAEERTPVEGRKHAQHEKIVAAAADLPEAPLSLDDSLATDDIEAVTYEQFSDTLVILRSRLADAGVPDGERLLESIELLRRHPSVRAALTEP